MATPMGQQAASVGALAGIWAAVPTPFLADGAVDLEGVAGNATLYRDRFGCDGIFCNGIMGEGFALTLSERQDVLTAMLAGAGDAMAVGVVVTHHAPAEMLTLARHAGQAGAHHIILMRPRGQYLDDELIALAAAAVDAAGRPLVIFESPAPGMSFGANIIDRLARRGLVLAVKAPGGDKAVAGLRRQVADARLICNPHEDQFLVELARNPEAPLYANPEPYLYQSGASQPIRAYRDALIVGDAPTAYAHWRRLQPLRAAYDRWVMGELDHGRSPVPALKHWAARAGLKTGPTRFPLQPLPAEAAAALDAELDAAGAPRVG